MGCECRVNECGNLIKRHTCKLDLPCTYGRFNNIMSGHVGHLCDYKVFQYVDGVIKATVHGKLGNVEIYGGRHAKEIWFISRQEKAETEITDCWYLCDPSYLILNHYARPKPLDEALQQAFDMAGVQLRMQIPDDYSDVPF